MLCFCSNRLKASDPEYQQIMHVKGVNTVIDVSELRVEKIPQNAPFIWFGGSGGTEMRFKQLPFEKIPLPLVVCSLPKDNSSAAAQEDCFYLRRHLIPYILCENSAELANTLEHWAETHEMVRCIQTTRLLRIGDYSDWLINEDDAHYQEISLPKLVNRTIEQFMQETEDF